LRGLGGLERLVPRVRLCGLNGRERLLRLHRLVPRVRLDSGGLDSGGLCGARLHELFGLDWLFGLDRLVPRVGLRSLDRWQRLGLGLLLLQLCRRDSRCGLAPSVGIGWRALERRIALLFEETGGCDRQGRHGRRRGLLRGEGRGKGLLGLGLGKIRLNRLDWFKRLHRLRNGRLLCSKRGLLVCLCLCRLCLSLLGSGLLGGLSLCSSLLGDDSLVSLLLLGLGRERRFGRFDGLGRGITKRAS
jgi:hypothetical protein